jgi:hypothetical protein
VKLAVSAAFVASLATLPTHAAYAGGAEGQVHVSAGVSVGTPQPQPRRYRRAPGPRLMPPLRIDLGGIGAASDFGTLTGAEVSIGIHWASLSPTPTDFDIGIGAFGGVLGNSRTPVDPVTGDNEQLTYGGLYGEYGHRLSGGDFWRTWASGRGEYLSSDGFGETHRGVGVSAKLEAELFLSGVGVSPDGIFLGTYAIGLYVQGGVRRLSNDVSDLQLGLGVTIRTPMVWRW